MEQIGARRLETRNNQLVGADGSESEKPAREGGRRLGLADSSFRIGRAELPTTALFEKVGAGHMGLHTYHNHASGRLV